MSAATLEVRGLNTSFAMPGGALQVVRGVDLDLAPGEVLGLIGESGSGKTVTGLSLLRLLPQNARMSAERLRFLGTELQGMPEEAFRALRGTRLAMVFQNPAGALNPAKTIGWHLREVLARAAASHPDRADWRDDALRLLAEVGIPEAERILHLYPHQLSGGMLQRALIAMILALEPALVVADEPTTNLDNIVERQILALFRRLQKRLAASFIFITHDMTIAASLCDRIAVMYAGTIVESGPTRDIFAAPKHPYTQGLIETALALDRGDERLAEIPGELPSLANRPSGCLYAPRCPHAMERCRAAAPGMVALGDRSVRCFLHG
jgi:peptide/nickel transport system ATP-binding protein